VAYTINCDYIKRILLLSLTVNNYFEEMRKKKVIWSKLNLIGKFMFLKLNVSRLLGLLRVSTGINLITLLGAYLGA